MYNINKIIRADNLGSDMRITAIKPLDDMMLLITFSTGETHLYDASQLLEHPAFLPLQDEAVFREAKIEYGVVTWLDGNIDIAPETMYQNSYTSDGNLAAIQAGQQEYESGQTVSHNAIYWN